MSRVEIKEIEYGESCVVTKSPISKLVQNAEKLADELIELSENGGVPISFKNTTDAPHFEMTEGDVTSNEMGTAARASDSKPRFDLMPIGQLAELFSRTRVIGEMSEDIDAGDVLNVLGEFQAGDVYANSVLEYCVAFAWQSQPTAMTVLDVLEETCHVWDYGRIKYAEWNWAKGAPWRIPIGCLIRHLNAAIKDPDSMDEDSGYSHQAHMICNAMMLVHYQEYWNERGSQADTRPFQYFGHPEAPTT